MKRAAKNESASTSGSDREGSSEGSLKHTVLTSSSDSESSSEISLMVNFTSNCRMYIAEHLSVRRIIVQQRRSNLS